MVGHQRPQVLLTHELTARHVADQDRVHVICPSGVERSGCGLDEEVT
jgi:hypothetical protein